MKNKGRNVSKLTSRQPLCCCEITVCLLLKSVCHSGDAGHQITMKKEANTPSGGLTALQETDMRKHLHRITESTQNFTPVENSM